MNNRKEGVKRTFVPKTIGETVKKINKIYANKFGKIEYLILSKWPQIVGVFFADHSEPEKISYITENVNEMNEPIYQNTLYVKVSPAAAVEFQHYQDKIIEKINSYFGYKAIAELRLHQNFVPKKNSRTIDRKQNFSEEDKNHIKRSITNIKNKDLEKSIVKLGLSINRED